MTTILDVHAAWRELIPSSEGVLSWSLYQGQAPDDAVAPWVVSGFRAPEPIVDESGSVSSYTGSVYLTIAALTEDQATFIDSVMCTLLGQSVTVVGYTVGCLTKGTSSGPYPAGLTASDTDLRFQVIRREMRFTYSKIS